MPVSLSESEALYAALRTPLGVVVRGDLQALQRERSRLAREDEVLATLSILGPDPSGQLWIVRKDKL
jgi:hypothetical protein